jgi:hypothetical protein
MGITLIHGFLKEKQKAKPEWGSISIVETVLIEMDSATENIVDVLTELPAAPNTVTATNPKGISFTFDISLHPDSNVFVLRSAGEVKQSDQGAGFWEVELTYAIFSVAELLGAESGSGSNPKKRKDQREETNPVSRPVVWHRSTTTVTKETYRHATTGSPIVHTNGLPITSPVKHEEIHTIHTFAYNVDYASFDDDDYEPFVGKIGSTSTLGYSAGKVKFSSYQANEEYESIGQGVNKTEYHYVRVTLSFEVNPSGWDIDAKLVSMSTVQFIQMAVFPFAIYYDKIRISATEYAQEPWPLDANGVGIPYDDNDPVDYGYIDHGYPRTINLAAVISIRSLSIP